MFTDAGFILIASISDLDDYEFSMIKELNHPHDILLINVGENHFNQAHVDLSVQANADKEKAIKDITGLLQKNNVILDYMI